MDIIIDWTQMIDKAFNRKQRSLCLFCNLTKAFDIINHTILNNT